MGPVAKIYICPHCQSPNVYDMFEEPLVNSLIGREIPNLPENIKNIYFEIRACFQARAYTASVMLMRKLLMNIAVDGEADEGKSFVFYVDYLGENNYVTRSSSHMLDKIRVHGNGANHKIDSKSREDAEYFLKFVEMLLANNYEYIEVEK